MRPTPSGQPLLTSAGGAPAAGSASPSSSCADSSALLSLLPLRGGMSVAEGWGVLFAATLFELVSTYFMHAAQGFSRPLQAALACVFYAASFLGFNFSLRALEISIAYAVWSAAVMAVLSFVGMAFLGESVSSLKVAGIALIVVGTTFLNLATTG